MDALARLQNGHNANGMRDSNCSSEAGHNAHKAGQCALQAGSGAKDASMDLWLHGMLRSSFFTPCEVHSDLKKHEVTHYCIDCCSRSCPHCLPAHAGHRVLQVRRYVYTNVVRASDMSPLLDVSGVQTYIINQAKVMFLNQRPQSKLSSPGAPDACATCCRTLREGCTYCCLACKVEALVAAGKLGAPSDAADAAAAAAATGSASDSSDCWPCGAGAAAQHCGAGDAGSGDSSSSEALRASSWGQAALAECVAAVHDGHAAVGALAAWQRRQSDSDSDGRCSSGSYCSRRKQVSPRRSPLL